MRIKSKTSAQVDLYNTEDMPQGITNAPTTGTSNVVLTQAGLVNLYYLPLNQDSVNAAGFTDGKDSKYDGERLNDAIDWYLDADFKKAITSYPYVIAAGKTEAVYIYGDKAVEIMQVYAKDSSVVDTLTYGKSYSKEFLLDSLTRAQLLAEQNIEVIGWKNTKGDTITNDASYKFIKNDTLTAICDTMLLLNFYSNDDVNTLYQVYITYNDTLVDYLLTDTVKYVGDSTYTFHGWYVPMNEEKFYYFDKETKENVQYEWNEEIVKDKYNMMPWYTLVKWYNKVISDKKCAQLADEDFGGNHVINIYGYWPYDPTGGDPTVDPTGINEVNGASENAKTSNGRTYNLAGQEVDSNYSGVVIQNGAKHIQK